MAGGVFRHVHVILHVPAPVPGRDVFSTLMRSLAMVLFARRSGERPACFAFRHCVHDDRYVTISSLFRTRMSEFIFYRSGAGGSKREINEYRESTEVCDESKLQVLSEKNGVYSYESSTWLTHHVLVRNLV